MHLCSAAEFAQWCWSACFPGPVRWCRPSLTAPLGPCLGHEQVFLEQTPGSPSGKVEVFLPWKALACGVLEQAGHPGGCPAFGQDRIHSRSRGQGVRGLPALVGGMLSEPQSVRARAAGDLIAPALLEPQAPRALLLPTPQAANTTPPRTTTPGGLCHPA